MGFPAEVPKIGWRHIAAVAPAGTFRPRRGQAIGILEGQRREENSANDAEDAGARSKADDERE
jgi:hypothetical protein